MNRYGVLDNYRWIELVAADGRNENDGSFASFLHVRNRFFGQEEGSLDINIEYLVPNLFRRFHNPAGIRINGRVRYQNVESAKFSHRLLFKNLKKFQSNSIENGL